MRLKATVFFLFTSLLSLSLQAEEKHGFERLVVQRSGGGGGIQETYEVTSDGKYKFSDLKTMTKGQLEGDDLKLFVDVVNKVEWAKLPKNKPAEGAARFKADQFQYSVAIITNKTVYTLSFHESAYAEDKAILAFLTALTKLK